MKKATLTNPRVQIEGYNLEKYEEIDKVVATVTHKDGMVVDVDIIGEIVDADTRVKIRKLLVLISEVKVTKGQPPKGSLSSPTNLDYNCRTGVAEVYFNYSNALTF